jgi:hypothetical protein
MRGDMKATAEYLARLTLAGIIERNEAREKLDLNPLEGLDEPLTPTNMTNDPSGAPAGNLQECKHEHIDASASPSSRSTCTEEKAGRRRHQGDALQGLRRRLRQRRQLRRRDRAGRLREDAAQAEKSGNFPSMLLQHGGWGITAQDMMPVGVWDVAQEDARASPAKASWPTPARAPRRTRC